jgi:hypothetical protein
MRRMGCLIGLHVWEQQEPDFVDKLYGMVPFSCVHCKKRRYEMTPETKAFWRSATNVIKRSIFSSDD